MADSRTPNLDRPDEVVRFPGLRAELVEVGDVTIARITTEPGWRWSTHLRPRVGGQWCQARHLGLMLKGQWASDTATAGNGSTGPTTPSTSRQVTTPTFDSAGRGLHCADAIRLAARADGLCLRAGVHVGEVELVGDDVRA